MIENATPHTPAVQPPSVRTGSDRTGPPAAGTAPFTVAVSHGDEILRGGLQALLQASALVRRVLVAGDSGQAAETLVAQRPDVLLVSATFDADALESLSETAARTGTKLLLLLASLDHDSVRRASRIRADGMLLEPGLSAHGLSHALETLWRGETPVPPALVQVLMNGFKESRWVTKEPQLTPRERSTLALLVEGMSNKQIARRLGISEHGAKRHVANVLAKLNCPNRTVAAVQAVEHGLIPAPGR